MAYTLTGQEKLGRIREFFTRSSVSPARIADLGGNRHSLAFLRELFPGAEILTINNYKPHLEGCSNSFLADVEKDKLPLNEKSIDIVFASDIIEHLVDPDKLIEKSASVLKPGGLLVITTPNFANLFNRLFLLLGFSFSNYHPSRYRTGNPFFRVKESIPLWNENAHKSVFTIRALKELLGMYSFNVLSVKGFSYSQKIKGGSEKNVKIRKLINNIIPTGLKEGMVVIAKK